MIEWVDPFIGTTETQLPERTGLAASWWSPKPQIGNTHPGATHPFGMVSACAYSGAYRFVPNRGYVSNLVAI